MAEDHDRQGKETETRHAVFKLPDRYARQDVAQAAQTAQRTGNQHARPAHLVYTDANRGSRLRMFAACHQPQTQPVFVQENIYQHNRDDGNHHEPVELKSVDIHDKHLPGGNIFNLGRMIIRIGGGVHRLYKHGRRSRRQQVHRCANQCLVRIEVNCCHT